MKSGGHLLTTKKQKGLKSNGVEGGGGGGVLDSG